MPFSKSYKNTTNIEREDFINHATPSLNDGILSISALLALFLGMGQRPTSILQILLAATIAGALSMVLGAIIATRTQKEDTIQEERDARMEVFIVPELKKKELREIYRLKGFKGEFLDEIVEHITMDDDWTVRELALDEIAVAEILHEKEWKNALIILVAFLIGALFPLFPYIFVTENSTPLKLNIILIFAIVLIIIGLFFVGSLKTHVTNVSPVKAGIEMVAMGLALFVISYLLGYLLPF